MSREYNPKLIDEPYDLLFLKSDEVEPSFWESLEYWVRRFYNSSMEISSIDRLHSMITCMIENYNWTNKPNFQIYYTILVDNMESGKLELKLYRSKDVNS